MTKIQKHLSLPFHSGKSPSKAHRTKECSPKTVNWPHTSIRMSWSFPAAATEEIVYDDARHQGFDCCYARLCGYSIEKGAKLLKWALSRMFSPLTFGTVSFFSNSCTD